MIFEKKARKSGSVLKSHGRQGEVLISSDFNLPDKISKLESIFIAIDEQLVPFFIEEITPKSSKTAAVKLEDIDTIEEANELATRDWYLPEEHMNLVDNNTTPEPNLLIGFTVLDQNDQELGVIKNIQEIPSNTLLEVEIDGELYDIPFNEETVLFIDQESKILKNHIPEGLLDL